MTRFRAIGDFGPDQLRTTWVASSHAPPPEAADAIERAWRDALARPGIHLFDGPMCRLESWSLRDGALHLALSGTSYKAFWGTNLANPHLADRFGPAALANPVGVSALVETADRFLLLGRRNAAVAYYPRRLHPFAGSLEPGDAATRGAGHGPDPFATVRRELGEELAFTDADVASCRCLGIVEDVALRQPELIFHVRSPLARGEVEARVARDEHQGSVAGQATRDGLAALLPDPSLTPVAVGALLLWGKGAFGDVWFAAQSGRGERAEMPFNDTGAFPKSAD